MRSEIPMTDKAHAIADGIKTVPAAGDTTTWLRDEATGLVTNKVYADGKGPTYTYTPDGRLATRTWARGIVTTYSYDDNGSLTNTVYSDGTPTISLAYNRAGRQVRAEDAAGVTTFLYDDFGALINETVLGVAGTNTIERFYDSFGRNAGYALNGLRQSTLAYDPATGRLVTMEVPVSDGSNNNSPTPNSNFFTWTYLDGSDRKSSLVYPNGLTASWQYDANGQLLQVKNAFPANTISQYDYTYDAAGRRIQISRSGSAMSENRTDVYGYNGKGELISAVKQDAVPETEYAYEYDDMGNRITSFDLGTNRTYIANNLNQYTQISNLCDSSSLREEFLPQFDEDGNQTLIQTSTGIWQVLYNGENRPVLWSNGSTNVVMSFDRMGRRVKYIETCGSVTNSNRKFSYDGYLQIANFEHSTLNFECQTFVWDPTELTATRPLVWNRNEASSFYMHDGNKNVSEILSPDGEIAAHYEYAPFGTVISIFGDAAFLNSWRFSSEYEDRALGLTCYNYRHYIPQIGRWATEDPSDEGWNLYMFVENSCMDSFDQLGLKESKQEQPKQEQTDSLEDVDSLTYNTPRITNVAFILDFNGSPKNDVLGATIPRNFYAHVKCACTKGKWKLVVITKLHIDIKVVNPGVPVAKDGVSRPRTRRGYARTIEHENEHVAHFEKAYYDVHREIEAERVSRAGYEYLLPTESSCKKAASEINAMLSDGTPPGRIMKIWKDVLDQEDKHSGDAWKEWAKKHGGKINDDEY